jgi:hypothetical protein
MNHLQPKTYANKLSWCLGVVMTLLLAGCNSGDKDPILTPDELTGLTQIVVNPTSPNIPAGLTRQFEALGVYANGTSVNISDRVSWSSATSTVATVNATGMVNAKTNGSSLIAATFSGKTGQTTLTVTDAALVSISLTPLANSAISGVDVQFAATGVYSNGTSQNLTSTLAWTSSDVTVARFNPDSLPSSGLASALAPGVSTLTASMAGISASTTFTVTASSLTALVITPANPTVVVGLTQQMKVTGTFNNGTNVDLTSQAIWSSADANLLTFNASGAADSGLARAMAAGTVAVSASFGGTTANSNLLINNPELTALTISPTPITIAAGNSQQFIATGVYNNGTSANISSLVTWASGDTNIAILNANLASDSGLATSLIPGQVIIGATVNTVTGPLNATALLTVSNAVVTSLTLTPTTPQLINGFTQQFQATANFSDQSTVAVTTTASWSSSDTAVVTMNASGQANSGLATPVMAGSAVITATIDATTSGSTLVTVVEATLTSMTIAPLAPVVAAGRTQQFSATGTFSNGNVMNLNRLVAWQSDNAAAATFNPNFQSNSGLLTALVIGNSEVSASLNGVTSSTTLTVSAATLVSMVLNPLTPAMNSGQTLQMQLLGTYSDNSVVNLTTSALWSTNNSNIAIFNPNSQADSGLVSAVGVGSATLLATITTADLQAMSSSTLLTVTPALAVNPQAPILGTVANFVMAASQGISTTAGSTIANGDIAILDTNRAAFSGFVNGTSAGQFTVLTNGTSYAPDDENPPYPVPVPYANSAAYINQLKIDLATMATFLTNANPTAVTTALNGPDIGGLTLNRGVYLLSGDVMISQSPLTLDAQGDANSVFIFYINGNFSTALTGGNIVLLNGAKASNVYWRIGGNTTLGANRQLAGNVVSNQSIQLLSNASVQGRLISVAGNIVLDANNVTKPF